MPRQHRDDRLEDLADRPTDFGLPAGLGHTHFDAVRRVVFDPAARLIITSRGDGSRLCITIFVTKVRAALCCVRA